MTPRTIPGTIGRVTLLVGALACSIGVVEGVARTVSPAPAADAIRHAMMRPLLFEPHPTLAHVPRPGASATVWTPEWQARVSFNSLGVRGPEPVSLPPGGRRVLMLGDSFTLGAQVDDSETAARLMEALLSGTRPTRIWNAGVENHGTWQAVERAAELVAAGHTIDALVLNLYMGNDLIDDSGPRPSARRAGRARRPSFPQHQRSSHGRHTSSLRRPPPSLRSLAWASLLLDRARTGQDAGHRERLRREVGMWCDGPHLQEALPHTEASLTRLAGLARQHNIPLLVALLPPEWVVDPQQGLAAADSLGLTGFDPTRVPTALRSVMPDGVQVFDLTEPMRQAASSGALYYRYDGHWTPAGHAAVARALAEPVESLLPPEALTGL